MLLHKLLGRMTFKINSCLCNLYISVTHRDTYAVMHCDSHAHTHSFVGYLCSLGRFEAIPDKLTPDEILEQAQSAADAAADKVDFCAPNSKVYAYAICFHVVNSSCLQRRS